MRGNANIAVIIPAYNEALLIERTLAGIPAWVDAIYVVDDASQDDTQRAVQRVVDRRVQLLVHAENRGVGAAIATGYQHALLNTMDVMAVMAGDDQMDPNDLATVVDPVVERASDYVKGNRFIHPEAHRMPWVRRMGGRYLSALTRMATGLKVDDTQCGYTAISRSTLERIPLDRLWPSFGYPNDLLLMLAGVEAHVAEVPVRPVYAEEASGIRPWHLATITSVVLKRWLRTSPLLTSPTRARANYSRSTPNRNRR